MHHCIVMCVTHCCPCPSAGLPPSLWHGHIFPWKASVAGHSGCRGWDKRAHSPWENESSFRLTDGPPYSSFSFLLHIQEFGPVHFVVIKGLPSTLSRCPCCCPSPGLDQVSSGLLAPMGPGLSACPHQIMPPHGFFTVSPLPTPNNYLRLPQIDLQNKV